MSYMRNKLFLAKIYRTWTLPAVSAYQRRLISLSFCKSPPTSRRTEGGCILPNLVCATLIDKKHLFASLQTQKGHASVSFPSKPGTATILYPEIKGLCLTINMSFDSPIWGGSSTYIQVPHIFDPHRPITPSLRSFVSCPEFSSADLTVAVSAAPPLQRRLGARAQPNPCKAVRTTPNTSFARASRELGPSHALNLPHPSWLGVGPALYLAAARIHWSWLSNIMPKNVAHLAIPCAPSARPLLSSSLVSFCFLSTVLQQDQKFELTREPCSLQLYVAEGRDGFSMLCSTPRNVPDIQTNSNSSMLNVRQCSGEYFTIFEGG